jgi:GPH family glycoside/pentoside/hexuronide:cation symporter
VVGYFSDRPYRFTKKWGRRFPWIIGSFIPMLFFFVLIFYPPIGESQLVIFLWLIVTTCVFDTLESVFIVNYYGLFPDKFRDSEERVTAAAIGTYFIIIGTVLGTVVPPMIIVFGEVDSYVLMAWLTVVIGLICYLFFIPGVGEDKESVESFVVKFEEAESKSISGTFLTTLKQKNFIVYLLLILGYFTMINTWGASLLYYARYVLGTEAELVSVFLGTMFIGAAIGVIIWYYYVQRTNDHRFVLIVGGLIVIGPAMLITFITDVTAIIGIMAVAGLGVGGFLIMMTPTFSDVIDESIIQTQMRNEGLFGGIRFFVTNFSRVTTAVILAVVHILTGFIEGEKDITKQPAEAIFGIQLHTGIIPALFFLAGIIIFWKYYDITPQKAEKIKEELKSLKL